MGFEPVLLDNDPTSGGGTDGDILNDDVHNNLLRRVASGEFLAIFASLPPFPSADTSPETETTPRTTDRV